MALIRIPEQDRLLKESALVKEFLTPFGIIYERWPVEGRVPAGATADEILSAYAHEVEALKRGGGYITADVIDVTPDVPNLQTMLDRFNKEHTHAEDEVRFIVKGHGIFHIHPIDDLVFALEVEQGDLINVPAGTHHWFDLCADRTIRAIRLFREKAGWTPLYTGSSIAKGYQPVCFGPSYLPTDLPEMKALALDAT
jgi:1,2-dihydroxy-3-keto-5-methylthiopentene dioxygenase